MGCIFCKIASGEIKSTKLYEDDKMVIFKDTEPQAPIHLLAIPKSHIKSAVEITPENSSLISHIFEKISELKSQMSLDDGCRIVVNSGANAGQTVDHLHFHILSGRKLSWPPG